MTHLDITAAVANDAWAGGPRASARSRLNCETIFWIVVSATCVLRVIACFIFDLNLMESYGVVMARDVSLSYVDHPPLTWWLIGLVTHIFGSETAIVVRAPFILLSIGSSRLLYCLTGRLFGSRSALYATVAFAFSPLFSLWVGALALTDGLTILFLLASVSFLARIFFGPEEGPAKAWIIWLSAGLCFGLALASKYTAILLLPGCLIFVLTAGSGSRGWLLRPQPYVAVLAALVPLLPVFVWNAEHGWASFLYQGGRAGWGYGVHPDRAIRWIGMQIVYLQPLIFVPAMIAALGGVRSGPKDQKIWFCICLAIVPLVFFPSVMLWSSHALRGFHWGAIGWVMLFPLIGDVIRRLAEHQPRWARAWTAAIAGTFALALIVLISHAMTGWITVASRFVDAATFDDKDPILTELFDWTDLRQELNRRHIDPTRTFVAGTRWESCAKAAYALNDSYRVLCLAPQNVHFTYLADLATFRDQDALIVDLSLNLKDVKAILEPEFDSIEELPPIALTYFGRRIMALRVYRGIRFHGRPAGSEHAAPQLTRTTVAPDAAK